MRPPVSCLTIPSSGAPCSADRRALRSRRPRRASTRTAATGPTPPPMGAPDVPDGVEPDLKDAASGPRQVDAGSVPRARRVG